MRCRSYRSAQVILHRIPARTGYGANTASGFRPTAPSCIPRTRRPNQSVFNATKILSSTCSHARILGVINARFKDQRPMAIQCPPGGLLQRWIPEARGFPQARVRPSNGDVQDTLSGAGHGRPIAGRPPQIPAAIRGPEIPARVRDSTVSLCCAPLPANFHCDSGATFLPRTLFAAPGASKNRGDT